MTQNELVGLIANLNNVNKDINDLKYLIDNYQTLLIQGQVKGNYQELLLDYSKLINTKQSLEAVISSVNTPAPQIANTGLGNMGIGNNYMNSGGVVIPQMSGINATNDTYSTKTKNVQNIDDHYVPQTPNTQTQTQNNGLTPEKIKELMDGVINTISTTNKTTPQEKRDYDYNNYLLYSQFFKESAVGVTKNDLGITIITGVSSELATEVIKSDEPYIISPLYSILEFKSAVCYISPLKNVLMHDRKNQLSNKTNRGFNNLTFNEIITSDSIEYTIYQNLKDIIIENLASLLDSNNPNASDITDIKGLIDNPDFETKKINVFSDIFKEVKILYHDKTIKDYTNNEFVGNLFELDLGGDHVYFDSPLIDFEALKNVGASKSYNKPFKLTIESYRDLYNVMINNCRKHGILELRNGIKYRYYILKDVIKLVKL